MEGQLGMRASERAACRITEGPPRQPGEIAQLLGILSERLASLSRQVEELRDVLRPVLSERPQTANKEKADRAPVSTTLGSSIFELITTCEDNIHRIMALRDSVEL